MTPEDKQILSEAISEGIENGFWKPIGDGIKIVLIGVIVLTVIFIGLVQYSNYKQEQCVEDGSCIQNIAIPQPEDFNNPLYCSIYVGNTTYTESIMSFKIIGYTEANAKYEQLKSNIIERLRKQNSSMSLKYLNCE